MSRFIRSTLCLVSMALATAATAARAQGKAVELTAGMIGFTSISCSNCSSTSTFTTGGPYVSAGFYLSPRLAIEPSLSLQVASGSGSSATVLGLAVGVPIYFDQNWGRKGWYVTPRLTYLDATCSGCGSASQFGAGVAIGGKMPLNENAALRLQASYDYGFESSNVVSTSTIGASIGLSVFVK